MNKLFLVLLFLISTCLTLINASDGHAKKKENARGKQLFLTCMACHGDKGQGTYFTKAPAIAAMPAWYTIAQIKKFKDGSRGAHPQDVTGLQMRPMAKTLHTEADVEAVADYISNLAPQKAPAKIHGDKEKGKVAFMMCMACHGQKAEGNLLMKAPNLANLPDWYIVDQLAKFKKGIRGTYAKDITGKTMRPMAMGLDKATRENLAAYIYSLTETKDKKDHGSH